MAEFLGIPKYIILKFREIIRESNPVKSDPGKALWSEQEGNF